MTVTLKGKAPETDEQWLEWASAAGVRRRSDYTQFIPLWQTTFPAEQLLFIPFGDLVTDPIKVLRRIEDFIDVKPFAGYKALTTKFNRTAPVAIPTPVLDFVSKQMERQMEFLTSTFGEDFVARVGNPIESGSQPVTQPTSAKKVPQSVLSSGAA